MIDSTNVQNVWTVLARLGSNEIALLVLVIVACLILFVIITKPNLKIGSNYISFGSRKRGKRSPHTVCPYNIDFFHVITKTTEIVTKICYLEHIIMVERQIDYVEQKIVNIKTLLMQNYASFLNSRTADDNVTAHEDYIVYTRLVDSMLREDIKSFIKRTLINDDLLDMSDTEFRVYVKEKGEYLYQIGSQFMDTWYISNKMLISREELRKSVFLLKDKFNEIISDIFSHAVTILYEVNTEKIDLQKELENFCEKVIGLKNDKIQKDKGD
jgi:hypothetical protein